MRAAHWRPANRRRRRAEGRREVAARARDVVAAGGAVADWRGRAAQACGAEAVKDRERRGAELGLPVGVGFIYAKGFRVAA